MTDNELIAEFMGMSSFKTEHDTFWHPTEKASPENWKYHSLDLDHFYEKSWDWLMPVVEKIYLLREVKQVSITPGKTRIWFSDHIKDSYIESPLKPENNSITECFSCVVKFIKWYNQQK